MTPETTGPKWFNMPAPELTQEVKRELHILKSRGVLDPKRHYKRESKKSSSGGMPKFFQFGTVVAGAQDYYSGGGGSVKRKIGSNNNSSSSSSGGGLVDEVLADADKRAYFKRKFMDLQEKRRIKYGGFNKTKKKNGKKGGKSQN